tara:strand:- start:1329 stop:1457 length:129 start_codon:yes stop_codon:yes gene_type:complete
VSRQPLKVAAFFNFSEERMINYFYNDPDDDYDDDDWDYGYDL